MGTIDNRHGRISAKHLTEIERAMSDDAHVVIKSVGTGRPYLLRVTDGLVHTHRLTSVDVVGVSHSPDATLIHVQSK